MHSVVDTILLENIDNPASLFVFPTDVAASRWADRLLRLRHEATIASNSVAGNTIALEKFIAWDTFKQNSIRSKAKDRHSIPSALRKMFVSALIRENGELCAQGKPPLFTSLIRAEWARQADSFTSWLTGILPQLGTWCSRTIGLPAAQIGKMTAAHTRDLAVSAGDDSDLYTLTLHYAQFLDNHGLFEPAWETPPFEDTGMECYIFFPESLSDFGEYKELLAASSHVQTVSISDNAGETQPCECFFYTNSRSEITEAALYILALHNNRVPWDSISVSIPDDENYRPYLLREFENRNIPYIMQSGKPLALYPAGQFFSAVSACAAADFSFASVKELLLNQHLPWKDRETIQDLISFGIRNNCISSWIEEDRKIAVNVWEDAFTHPLGGIEAKTRRFFEDLRQKVNAFCGAGSFPDIRKQYFAFRQRFFDMENCLDETDLILSRCISELSYLAEIEKSYPDVRISGHYAFFTGYLSGINYLAQQSASGVAILPYRTAAPAPFDCHIVLGASQSSLSAVYSPLGFLSRSRREQLGIADNDASLTFINLHRYNSRLPAVFFCSEQTFSGYAIPHHFLQGVSLNAGAPEAYKPRQRFGDDPRCSPQFAADLYRAESNFYASLHFPQQGQPAQISLPTFHKNQKQGFTEWRSRRNYAADANGPLPADQLLSRKIREKFCNNEEYKEKFSVSASSLVSYFQCPLLWVFSRLLKLENVEIDTGLMAGNITGEVYHSVLNLFLDELRKTGGAIAMPENYGTEKKPVFKLPQLYQDLLEQKIETVFEAFPRLPQNEYQVMSMLAARLLRAEKPLFLYRLENLLAEFTARFAGYNVIACEKNYALPKDSYYLNGRIDCIMELLCGESPEKNRLVIVDFKTKYKPDESLFDFQLPLYFRLAEESFKKEADAGLFFSIIDARYYDGITRENGCFNEIMGEFDQKSRQFAQEIASGAFSYFPSHPGQCVQCGYNKTCRTLYKVNQGKENGT